MGTSSLPASAWIDAYVAGTTLLVEAVRGFTPDQLHSRPVDGAWSTLEVVCHLADTEGLFAQRMKRVLAEDRPPLLFAAPEQFVAALACHERDINEELSYIYAARLQMARILRAQPAAAWQRTGIHNQAGEQSLQQLLQKATDHLIHHIRFIREKRAALGVAAP